MTRSTPLRKIEKCENDRLIIYNDQLRPFTVTINVLYV